MTITVNLYEEPPAPNVAPLSLHKFQAADWHAAERLALRETAKWVPFVHSIDLVDDDGRLLRWVRASGGPFDG